jgi:hypothetical protein
MGDRYVELVELEGEVDDFSLLLGVDSLFVSLFDSPFDSLFDSGDEVLTRYLPRSTFPCRRNQ